ncbi:MAG TPA: hypothetical protein VFQ07_02975, partial [Candidatus Polarisedimenticolia bacterium]|nr:hypothetical protein [Candidatus Polarisedimenticolia bacterium]
MEPGGGARSIGIGVTGGVEEAARLVRIVRPDRNRVVVGPVPRRQEGRRQPGPSGQEVPHDALAIDR